MQLVKCPACGREISPAAVACPGCGHPLKTVQAPPAPPASPVPKPASLGCGTLIVFGLVLFVLFAVLGTCSNDAPRPVSSTHAPTPQDAAATRKAWAKAMENPSNTATDRLGNARSLIRLEPGSEEAKRAKELLPTLQKAADDEAAARGEQASLGRWNYQEQSDDLTGKPYKLASVTSENSFEFGFPYGEPQHAQLVLRSHPRFGKSVMLQIERGQILCSSYSCPIVVVFDDGKPVRYDGNEPADNSSETVFIPAYSTFVKRLASAKTVRIAFDAFQEGNRVVEFKVKGFDPNRLK
jgi:hypothetical protein